MEAKMRSNVPDENIVEAFRAFDRDNDGFISLKELQHVMYCLGERDKKYVNILSNVWVAGMGKIVEKTVCKSIFLNCILSAKLTKTHSFRLDCFFLAIFPTGIVWLLPALKVGDASTLTINLPGLECKRKRREATKVSFQSMIHL